MNTVRNLPTTDIIPTPFLKQLFDVVASMIVILLLSPAILALLALSLLERCFSQTARGPFLYKETCMSRGTPFTLYKLRTFRMPALQRANGHDGVVHTKKLEHDFRNLTLVGMVLVQTYLDEFPQLFSVFLGKMSFVGPRPVNPEIYERYIAGGNLAKAILRAGLTGHFQTHKSRKYGLNQEQVGMKYAELCRSGSSLEILRHDLRILFYTVYTVIRSEGL
ncbi:hypothetical protein A2673_02135 [Candidatus Kaiserbacteria bacterium RIFCSPHIGHO2_01_FULL_50_13]|uniref:Bacterial sugar transferase domain-containing protein n=1 Tax=Candidatus Kaiserbacteria bacterium RIFCSPLOWO2_01_FULL_50_24 TaxID=1798507 RepID=A0A1F6ER56_9BACT|nr:MAG: hypothetical protein A2673_02135 [Candidatus Kaiserbacteria bacterium RIFCSPHIGHO2_01_FULL_50_13]OGG76116.1 MAG: hypothetical protein A3A34_00835 [Candidatus Kaiserbacteria bacterium RIFCSPLOWO2_01_FULL_50_24]OGG82353.1 MAG: hypothetical protein A3H74_00085 [Candidatus Kaiserbacteria bacterium RIFCSPLOWO2_02_FULL_51_13]